MELDAELDRQIWLLQNVMKRTKHEVHQCEINLAVLRDAYNQQKVEMGLLVRERYASGGYEPTRRFRLRQSL